MAMQFKPPSISPAAADLGMGDQVKQQLALQEEEKKKKMLMQANNMQSIGPGTMALFGVNANG